MTTAKSWAISSLRTASPHILLYPLRQSDSGRFCVQAGRIEILNSLETVARKVQGRRGFPATGLETSLSGQESQPTVVRAAHIAPALLQSHSLRSLCPLWFEL